MNGSDRPDGVIPLRRDGEEGGDGAAEEQRRPGCAIGCLYGTVALFVLLLAAMIGAAVFREWPQPRWIPGRENPPADAR